MTHDQVVIVLIAAGWAAAIGVVGLIISYLVRHRSLRWTLALVALVPVAAMIAGVIGTAHAMYISSHDLGVALLVCAVAGPVAAAVALVVATRIGHGSTVLTEAARTFGETGQYDGPDPGPKEFRQVSAELTRAGERLTHSRNRERRLEASRRELIAWVSHDLRTPLAGLRAMTEAIEDDMVDDPQRYHLQMRSEVDRMVRMVDDLFELSRIHAGVLQLSLHQVALADVVSEAIASADPVAQAAGVHLGGHVDEDIVVTADPNGLSRVVANLLSNAIRHTPSDGTVAITGQRVDAHIEISVTDGCGGIPDDDLARVFDVAWRGSPARTPRTDDPHGSGAGLGLAIAKGILEAHHGTIHVTNHVTGCRFLAAIPEVTAR